MSHPLKRLVTAGACVALGLILPSLFHFAGPAAGRMFLPMHIPVLLCGFLCGKYYGAACGVILPPLSSMLTGMPVMYPTGIAMIFELAAYGFFVGLLYQITRHRMYPALIAAMLCGRAVSGVANAALMLSAGNPYTLSAFLTTAFVTAIPGILLQLIFVPLLVRVLEKAGLSAAPAAMSKR